MYSKYYYLQLIYHDIKNNNAMIFSQKYELLLITIILRSKLTTHACKNNYHIISISNNQIKWFKIILLRVIIIYYFNVSMNLMCNMWNIFFTIGKNV